MPPLCPINKGMHNSEALLKCMSLLMIVEAVEGIVQRVVGHSRP